MITLGVISGMFWLDAARGRFFTGSAHELWSLIAWAIYAVMATVRFSAHQGSRKAAACAVGGFVFLFFAVVGVELLA